jgi:hypothetical protein
MNGHLGRRSPPSVLPTHATSAYSRSTNINTSTIASSSTTRPGWQTPDTPSYPPYSATEAHPLPPNDAFGAENAYAYSTTLRRAPQEDGMDRLRHTAEAIGEEGFSGIISKAIKTAKRYAGIRDDNANGNGYTAVPKQERETAAARFSCISIEVSHSFVARIRMIDVCKPRRIQQLISKLHSQLAFPPAAYLHFWTDTDPTSSQLQHENQAGSNSRKAYMKAHSSCFYVEVRLSVRLWAILMMHSVSRWLSPSFSQVC